MLKTLDRYTDDGPNHSVVFESPWSRLGRDRRFTWLFAISVVVHLVFYAVLIKLDSWAILQARQGVRQPSELVKFVDVAPPSDRIQLRRTPEPLERADLKRLQFDPASADDIHLIPRSPRPTERRGNAGRLPSADQIERQLRASRGNGGRQADSDKKSPPATAHIQANRTPTLEEASIAQAPPTLAATTPPAPPSTQPANTGAPGTPDAASAGTRRGSSSEFTALGLETAQAQYMALVRAKISKANERIMPRDWIKDVLRDKVSADFELIIRHDGQILSMRLLRGSGYSVLDASARQAIYTASPFEGFPQSAGNAITFTVKVYFYTL